MKDMKDIKQILQSKYIFFILVGLFLYLLQCFIFGTFNISKFNIYTKYFFALLYLFIGWRIFR